MIKRSLYIWITLVLVSIAMRSMAETGTPLVMRGTIVASYPFRLVKGFMLIDIPTYDTLIYQKSDEGNTVEPFVTTRSYLVDIGASNEGSWLIDSTSTAVITDYKHVSIPGIGEGTLPLSLIPSGSRENFRMLDSTFAGTIGYGWLKQYVSVFDFKEQRLYLYRSDNNPKFSPRIDTAATHIPYLDDAFITYCHCPYPTIWIDVEAPPLTPGRVQLSLGDNQSYVFKTALDAKSAKIVAQNERADSLSGKSEFAGIELANFIAGGRNIAQRYPRRGVSQLPPRFKDLNVTVIGTLAVDVLRRYDAFVIDPSRQKLILVR